MAERRLRHVGKRDSHVGLIVVQACICNGDQLGTRPDFGRGAGVARTFHLGFPRPERARPLNRRLDLGGIFWIARTGSPWCDLPEEIGKWPSVCRQFLRRTLVGL